MQRDKLVSIRVNFELFNKVKQRIDAHSVEHTYWGYQSCFEYEDSKRKKWGKLNLADLLEEKLEEYLAEDECPDLKCNTRR